MTMDFSEAHYQVVVMRMAMMVIIEVMMVMIVGTMVNKMVERVGHSQSHSHWRKARSLL